VKYYSPITVIVRSRIAESQGVFKHLARNPILP
jgi:hypothetical protein